MSGLLPPRRPKKPRRPKTTADRTARSEPDLGPETFGERTAEEMTDRERLTARVRSRVASDPSLAFRPALRAAREFLATNTLRNMDGSPLLDDHGKAIDVKLTMEQQVLNAAVALIVTKPDHPKWYETFTFVTTLLVGRPPADDVAAPLPPPPQQAKPDDDRQISLPEITAEKLEDVMERIHRVREARRLEHRDATAIDVTAELEAGDRAQRSGEAEMAGEEADDDSEDADEITPALKVEP